MSTEAWAKQSGTLDGISVSHLGGWYLKGLELSTAAFVGPLAGSWIRSRTARIRTSISGRDMNTQSGALVGVPNTGPMATAFILRIPEGFQRIAAVRCLPRDGMLCQVYVPLQCNAALSGHFHWDKNPENWGPCSLRDSGHVLRSTFDFSCSVYER